MSCCTVFCMLFSIINICGFIISSIYYFNYNNCNLRDAVFQEKNYSFAIYRVVDTDCTVYYSLSMSENIDVFSQIKLYYNPDICSECNYDSYRMLFFFFIATLIMTFMSCLCARQICCLNRGLSTSDIERLREFNFQRNVRMELQNVPTTVPTITIISDYENQNTDKYYSKHIKTKTSPNESELSTCLICLEESDNLVKLNICRCEQLYHKKCIDNWLREKSICPICKKS